MERERREGDIKREQVGEEEQEEQRTEDNPLPYPPDLEMAPFSQDALGSRQQELGAASETLASSLALFFFSSLHRLYKEMGGTHARRGGEKSTKKIKKESESAKQQQKKEAAAHIVEGIM